MSGNSRLAYRRFTLSLAGFVALFVAIFVTLNTWINPLWVTPTPWTDDDFAEWRPTYRQQRTSHAGLATVRAHDVAFFGSSRIDMALDPALPRWGENEAVNLAVSAGSLPESAGILRYTVAHNPLKLAVVGVDLGDLLTGHSAIHGAGYMESRFNERADAFERELRYFVGISTFEAACQTLINRRQNRKPEYTPRGHRLHIDEPDNVAAVIRRDSISHAVRLVRRRGGDGGLSPHPWKVESFESLLEETKRAGCALQIFIPPNHAAYLGVFHYLDDVDPVFELDRRAMLDMIEESNRRHPDAPPARLWDFNDFHPLNCEPIPAPGERMRYWIDGTHARKTLGDIMLARAQGWPIDGPGADYGVELTAENLDRRLAEIRRGYERFKSESPELWQSMVDAIHSYRPDRDPDSPAAEPMKRPAGP